ncbi:MAG: inorganic pyrophosphatase [Planctomycetota bacterium]|nr:MAG: inorganic pyrophosphatase [Planctomycetota bacterium]
MSFPSPFFRWRPHPWHGLDVGPEPPHIVHAYIEITPFDLVKYELDKKTGYLRVDRPQRTSSQPPALYGFIPRTYCGDRVQKLGKGSSVGDQDPLDICVISERPIERQEVILNARVVGGLQMIDHKEADDKIIAVLANDNLYGEVNEISDLPDVLVERLHHYFSTYKLVAGEESLVSIDETYGAEHAGKVIQAAMADYEAFFGE